MARTKNDTGVDAVRKARLAERLALAEAKGRMQELIKQETAPQHAKVLEAIKEAMFAGASKRQIAIAYGTTDAGTIKRLIEEATQETIVTENDDETHAWELHGNVLTVYNFGTAGKNGSATISIDEDGENITAVDGDLWIVPTAYRLGEVKKIVRALNG